MMIYAGGPFFAYPWKPLWNRLEGSTYEIAYKHFRRDHSDNLDLVLHCIALFYQLGSNYAVLNELDRVARPLFGFPTLEDKEGKATSIGPVSGVTSLLWAYELVQTPAPMVVKLGSVAMIAGAYSSKGLLEKHWEACISVQGVLEGIAIHLLLLQKSPSDYKGMAATILARMLLEKLVDKNKGSLSKHSQTVKVSVAVGMATVVVLSGTDKKFFSLPFLFGLIGWVLAKLTGQKWIYFWSCGYMASLCQGIAHNYTGELATLPQLSVIADDLAHTTYFPNLLLQSVYQSLNAFAQ